MSRSVPVVHRAAVLGALMTCVITAGLRAQIAPEPSDAHARVRDFALRQRSGQPRVLGDSNATHDSEAQSAVAIALSAGADHESLYRERGIAEQQ